MSFDLLLLEQLCMVKKNLVKNVMPTSAMCGLDGICVYHQTRRVHSIDPRNNLWDSQTPRPLVEDQGELPKWKSRVNYKSYSLYKEFWLNNTFMSFKV